MSQVSKRYLNKIVQDRIFSLYISSIVYCNSKDIAQSFFYDLLTPTERIMLSKRFSIAFMLLEGYSFDSINQVLKVSDSTIGNVSRWLHEKGDGFKKVFAKIKKNEIFKKKIDDIKDAFIDIITSSRKVYGSETQKHIWRERKKREKPF